MFKRRDVYHYRDCSARNPSTSRWLPRSSMFVSCTENRKTGAQNMQCYILIARVQGRIKRYRGGGRKGDGLRCEGGGRRAGRQQRSTGGRQMSRQNHSTNITTTTFMTQHKTKTATTIEISRQHFENKWQQNSWTLRIKSLRTPTTQVCERRCQRLTRCYGSRKVSDVFASTLSLLPRRVIFNLSTKILKAIVLTYHAAGASGLSLPRCCFHIIAQAQSDKILTHSQSRSMHRERTYIISRLLEVKGDSV